MRAFLGRPVVHLLLAGAAALLSHNALAHLEDYGYPGADVANGKKIFNEGKGDAVPACMTCHGAGGWGLDAMGAPRLAGIGYPYVLKQLGDLADGKLDRKKQSALYVSIGWDGGLASEPPTSLAAFNEEMARAKTLVAFATDADHKCIFAFREYEQFTGVFRAMFADLRPGALVEEERLDSGIPGVALVRRSVTVANVIRDDKDGSDIE